MGLKPFRAFGREDGESTEWRLGGLEAKSKKAMRSLMVCGIHSPDLSGLSTQQPPGG